MRRILRHLRSLCCLPCTRYPRADLCRRLHHLIDCDNFQPRLREVFQLFLVFGNDFRRRRETLDNGREYIGSNRGNDRTADVLELSCLYFDEFQLLADTVHFLGVKPDALDFCSVVRRLCVVLQGFCECHAADAERVHNELLPVSRLGCFLIALRQVLQLFVERQNLSRAVCEGNTDRIQHCACTLTCLTVRHERLVQTHKRRAACVCIPAREL